MDTETQAVLHRYKTIHDLIGHEGWKAVRQNLIEKVLELQNAFNIEESTPEKMLIDLQARKMASEILFDWLRQIEGEAQQSVENPVVVDKPYLYRV